MQRMVEMKLAAKAMNSGEDERGETVQEQINKGELVINTISKRDVRYNDGDDDNIVKDDERDLRNIEIRMTLLMKDKGSKIMDVRMEKDVIRMDALEIGMCEVESADVLESANEEFYGTS